MKKFLSLLLALTMVMSLVIVPARAEGVADGYAIRHHHDSHPSLALRGDSITFTLTATAPTVTDNGVTATRSTTKPTTALTLPVFPALPARVPRQER